MGGGASGCGHDDFSRETFDSRVDGFHLPTLSITTFVQMTFHLLSIAAHGFPGRRSAVLGGDQGLNPQFVAGQHVVGFAVEAGVRRDRLHSGASLHSTTSGRKSPKSGRGPWLARAARQK